MAKTLLYYSIKWGVNRECSYAQNTRLQHQWVLWSRSFYLSAAALLIKEGISGGKGGVLIYILLIIKGCFLLAQRHGVFLLNLSLYLHSLWNYDTILMGEKQVLDVDGRWSWPENLRPEKPPLFLDSGQSRPQNLSPAWYKTHLKNEIKRGLDQTHTHSAMGFVVPPVQFSWTSHNFTPQEKNQAWI